MRPYEFVLCANVLLINLNVLWQPERLRKEATMYHIVA